MLFANYTVSTQSNNELDAESLGLKKKKHSKLHHSNKIRVHTS